MTHIVLLKKNTCSYHPYKVGHIDLILFLRDMDNLMSDNPTTHTKGYFIEHTKT